MSTCSIFTFALTLKMFRQELATREHMFPHTPEPMPAPGVLSEAVTQIAVEEGPGAAIQAAAESVPTDEPLLKPSCSGYFLEPVIMLAPFAKKPLHLTLRGITTDEQDLSVSSQTPSF